MGEKHVTSVDVAGESGVSQATVARVFGSPELVAPATRAKVEAAAQRLGYVPNAIARSLKSQRTNIIGAVVPTEGEYWQHVLTDFSRQLTEQHKQLLVFSFSEQLQVDAVLETLAQYRVDGVILASSQIGQAQLARMQRSVVPVVAFNQPAAAGVVASVSVDNESGSRALAAHVLEQGCRSVLFVGGVKSASTDQTRYRGAAQKLGDHGVACRYVEAGSFSYEDGFKIADEIATHDLLPDAVMASSDELAFGVLDGLKSAGIDIPNDVLLTGFDGLPQASWNSYDLTTIVQSTDVLVERAIETLTGDRSEGEVANIVVPGTLRIGSTTAVVNEPPFTTGSIINADDGRPLGAS
jgi:DNA-binding LacI/PurR family transcriptional regulator